MSALRTRRRRIIFLAVCVTATVGAAGGAALGQSSGTSGIARALPPPRYGHTLDIGLVSGKVLVTPPGERSFRLGVVDRNIPVGSTLDTTHGRVDLRAARPPASPPGKTIEDAQFYDGNFKVAQPHGALITRVKLTRGDFGVCTTHARRTASGRAVTARRPHRVVRKLWGNGTGKFRTQGNDASATVRGTIWLTEDYCDGTLIRVKRGVVLVLNLVTHKTVTVTAGHSYFARAR